MKGLIQMPFTGHIRKREAKSGVATYQIVVEEENCHAGKRKRFYRTVRGNKRQAEQAMRKFISELEQNHFVKDSRITVREFMNQWLTLYIQGQLSPTTVQHYIYQTENYILPVFGDTYLQQLRNIDIQKWVFDLQKGSPQTGKPMSPKSVKNIVLNLSAAMKKAVMLDLIVKNPCDNLTMPKLERYHADVYDMEQVKRLLDCAEGTDMYLPIMIEICLGLRRGELLALKWKHIDLQQAIVTIEENIVTVDNKRITKKPKTKSGIRTLHMPSTLQKLLQEQKALRKVLPEEYVICQPDGSPYKSDSMSYKFRRFLKRHHLPHIRFHDLRHIYPLFSHSSKSTNLSQYPPAYSKSYLIE